MKSTMLNPMKKVTAIAFVISPVLFVLSCTKDVGKNPDLITKPAVGVCDSIKYAKDIQPIMIGNCATPGCHVAGGTGPGDFTTYAGVFSKVSNGTFKARVIDGTPGFMPSSGRLPAAEIEKIQCWLGAGAPNN